MGNRAARLKELHQILDKYTAGQLMASSPHASVIKIPSTASIKSALRILSDHKILSAPVYDAAHKKDLGIIDVMDFVFYALDNMNWESPAIYFSTDVLAVLEYSKHEPEVTTTADTKLVDIVDVMIDKRVHRIGITDQNVIQRLITQSGIISFLYDHLSELQNPDFDRSIEYLHLGSSPVICVSENLPVEEAFRTLREKKVSAVGVTDEYGVLVGSISGSQLKGIDEFSIGDLKLSVKDFLLRRGRRGFFIVQPYATFRFTLGLMKSHRLHRVFVVDHQGRPISIITLDTILQFCMRT